MSNLAAHPNRQYSQSQVMARKEPPPKVVDGQLTPRERMFVHHYLQCWNGTEAAIAAGFTDKYPAAGNLASTLLRNPKIKAKINSVLRTIAPTPDEVIARISSIATGSIGDFLVIDEETGHSRLCLKKAKILGKLHLVKRIKYNDLGIISDIELYSSAESLRDLGKIYALFTEKQLIDVNITHKVENTRRIVDTYLSDPEKMKQAAKLAEDFHLAAIEAGNQNDEGLGNELGLDEKADDATSSQVP